MQHSTTGVVACAAIMTQTVDSCRPDRGKKRPVFALRFAAQAAISGPPEYPSTPKTLPVEIWGFLDKNEAIGFALPAFLRCRHTPVPGETAAAPEDTRARSRHQPARTLCGLWSPKRRITPSLSLLAPSRPPSWERQKGAAGVMGGGRGRAPPGSGFEGAEPLASPNVIHWVGWLPFITRCGPAPLSPPRPPADQPAGPAR